MPLLTCPHCRTETFSVTGWVDLDHCGHCGKPLAAAGVAARQRRRRTTRGPALGGLINRTEATAALARSRETDGGVGR